jgi:5-methylcytosine-specific restriction protein A
MATYLLRWNPAEWPNDHYNKYFDAFEEGEVQRWSCGTTKKIAPGDHFFLMKSGLEGRGLIGSGTVLSTPRSEAHFNELKAAKGKSALYVDVKFDHLLKPKGPIPVNRHELDFPKLKCGVWDSQGSGKEIPSEIAAELAILWRQRVVVSDFSSADEITEDTSSLFEGAKMKVTVNAYERSADARRRCLDHWGYNCSVCQFRFDIVYGPLGNGYMHVHHLRPLAKVNAKYKVDPIKDLRPVCPNCHAMLHRSATVLSIEELQAIVGTYRSV